MQQVSVTTTPVRLPDRVRTALFLAAKADFDAALTMAVNANARHFGLTGAVEDWHADQLEMMARQLRDGCAKLTQRSDVRYAGEERRRKAR